MSYIAEPVGNAKRVLLSGGICGVSVPAAAAAVGWGTAAAVLVLFGAACLTKEHAVVLPALLLLTDYYWNPGFSLAGIRENWRLYVPMLAGGARGAGVCAGGS